MLRVVSFPLGVIHFPHQRRFDVMVLLMTPITIENSLSKIRRACFQNLLIFILNILSLESRLGWFTVFEKFFVEYP